MKTRTITFFIAGSLVAQADVLTSTQRFFGLGGQSPDYVENEGQTEASALGQAPYSAADSDLGVQEILEERAEREPLIVNLSRMILRTDSAPSGNSATDRSSWVFASSASIAWRPHIAQGWYADLGLGYDVIRYDRTNALDYENMNTRVGVFRVIPELDDTIFFARFEYQRITSNSLSDGDYNAQRVRAGLQKTLWSAPRQQLVGTISGAYEWVANPESLQRNEFAAEFVYRYAISDCLYAFASANVSRFDYDQAGREDWTYGYSTGLVWQFSENFSASASLFFDKNDSNTFGNANEYEAWSGGLGLGAQWTF